MCLLTTVGTITFPTEIHTYPDPHSCAYVTVHGKMGPAGAVMAVTQKALTREEYSGLPRWAQSNNTSLSKQRTISSWKRMDVDAVEGEVRVSRSKRGTLATVAAGPWTGMLSVSRIKHQLPADNQQGNWNLSPVSTRTPTPSTVLMSLERNPCLEPPGGNVCANIVT